MSRTGRKIAFTLVVAIAALLAIAQIVPYGRNHTNPPVTEEPQWDQTATRDLARRACFDCHSNQTRWPWYSHVAPASWLLQADVDEGRRVLNFSEWNRTYDDAAESAETVREREMPPRTYLLLHPEARLDAAQREALARGLEATLGTQRSSRD